MRLNKNNRVHKYWTCLVSIPDASGIHRFCPIGSKLDPFDFSFHTKLLALSSNCSQAQATQVDHKYSMKREIETHDVFYRTLASIETYSRLRGLRATQQRSALEDHEGHSSQSLFQLPFPPSTSLVPSLAAVESNRYKLSEAHHNVLGALRRHLAI